MATVAEHKSKAIHNEQFIEFYRLPEGSFVDWAITAIFYSALHWVRALAAQEGFAKVSSYAEMDSIFVRVRVFKREPNQYHCYRQLKDDSWEARYEMRRFAKSDYEELRRDYFEPLRSFVLEKLTV